MYFHLSSEWSHQWEHLSDGGQRCDVGANAFALIRFTAIIAIRCQITISVSYCVVAILTAIVIAVVVVVVCDSLSAVGVGRRA